MATLRPRNKKPKHEKEMEISGSTPKTRSSRNATSVSGGGSGGNKTSGSRYPPAVPLLDMLAEVASATLKNDPSLNSKNPSDKALKMSPRKSIQVSDVLSLDQIRVLSDRMLLEMFAELTSDEIRRHYSYKCFLLPDKCSESFKSFGSENRARLMMKSHLLTHIAELLAEANSTGKSGKTGKFRFTAEPLHARKKRLQDGAVKNRQKICKQRNPVSASKRTVKTKESQRSRLAVTMKTKKSEAKPIKSSSNVSSIRKSVSSSSPPKLTPKKGVSSSECENQDSSEDSGSDEEDEHSAKEKPVLLPTTIKQEPTTGKVALAKEDVMVKYVVDTLNQPQHDHNYTSVMGKKRGIEALHFEYCGSSEEEMGSDEASADSSQKYKKGYMDEFPQLIVATHSFPEVYVPLLPHVARIIEVKAEENEPVYANGGGQYYLCENVVEIPEPCVVPSNGYEGNGIASAIEPVSTVGKVKQTRSRRINRLIIPEELEPDSDDDNSNSEEETLIKQEVEEEYEFASGSTLCQLEPLLLQEAAHSPKYTTLRGDESTPEWERKLALKYIRALRTKRKDERGPLVCKICKNKTFTAQATLMYHYRSHAGIKPFICSVCAATFTRQHSLNYHMLIHNNKSRFVCGDCGRNFRHPSHYKEHLRRHTGETPYECGDCGLRFKTRNTYKRHLKTRHGKLLTAQGIVTLTMEEFYKVRTNPRRRNIRLNPMKKRDQETQWPDSMHHSS